jgi:hypothetical protein
MAQRAKQDREVALGLGATAVQETVEADAFDGHFPHLVLLAAHRGEDRAARKIQRRRCRRRRRRGKTGENKMEKRAEIAMCGAC